MSEKVDRYNTTYENFASELSAEIRSEAFGQDIGQNSWTTAQEQLGFANISSLTRDLHLLEVGCGAGGPAMFLARSVGLSVTGIDINEAAIAAASEAAARGGLGDRASFLCADCGGTFPFANQSFDAAQMTDAINHIPDRRSLLAELYRVIRRDGTLLYTDPVVITGAVSSEEIATRSSIGFFLFLPTGENERMLRQSGFSVERVENVTESVAQTSLSRLEAREKRRVPLIEVEGEKVFNESQVFLRSVHALSNSGRLSRFMFLARRQ